MPKLSPVVERVRDECVAIVDRLIASGEYDTYRDAFWYVYHVSIAKRTRCGFDAKKFDRAYEQYRRWKTKSSYLSQGQDDFTDEF